LKEKKPRDNPWLLFSILASETLRGRICFFSGFFHLLILFFKLLNESSNKPSAELDGQVVGFKERPPAVVLEIKDLLVDALLVLRT
jgi:hypothetical protein